MYFILNYLKYDFFFFKYMKTFFTEILNPLKQFDIQDLLYLDAPLLGNIHISITNIGFYLIVGLVFIMIMNLLGTNRNRLVSNN
jgi:F-type H+-transporting ATPase subunit a